MGKRLLVNGTGKLWKNRSKNIRVKEVKSSNNQNRKIYFLILIVWVSFFLLAFRLYQLQVVQYEENSAKVERMMLRRDVVPAPRGSIYDRNGILLANTTVKRVVNIIETFKGVYGRERTELIGSVAQQCGVTEIEVRDAMNRELDISLRADIPIANPNISVKYLFFRNYSFEGTISHLVGYVNSDAKGVSGIESTLNNWLSGEPGQYRIEVDSLTRKLTQTWVKKPKSGKNLTLSIDSRFQKEIEKLVNPLSTPTVVIVSNPKNGEILAMVSTPTYESTRMVQSLTESEWEYLQNQPDKIFLNRALQQRYNPGSLIKPWVALCAMNQPSGFFQSEVVGRYLCKGIYPVAIANQETAYYRDWVSTGHGEVNLYFALQKSCNTYFYTLGTKLGIDALFEFSEVSQLTTTSGIELPNETRGIFPSADWKKNTLGERWYLGDTLLASIGQSFVQLTPLQMHKVFELIANEGYIGKSTLIKELLNVKTKILDFPKAYWVYLKEALNAVIAKPGGTAFSVFSAAAYKNDFAGKTGTAETSATVSGEAEGGYHSWFAGFYPKNEPTFNILVLVEKGGYGSTTATPIAKQVFELYLQLVKGEAQ